MVSLHICSFVTRVAGSVKANPFAPDLSVTSVGNKGSNWGKELHRAVAKQNGVDDDRISLILLPVFAPY
jgi:hypothetical protein